MQKWTVILFYLSLIIIWQMAFEINQAVALKQENTSSYMVNLFPSPKMVGERLWELASEDNPMQPSLFSSIRATLARMGIGFSLSAIIGLSIGLLMGISPFINRCLKSLFLGFQTLPTVAWVPISLLIFGLKDSGIYFVIIMSSSAAVAISTADGIANIPPLFLRAARTLGTPPLAMAWRVILPAALPNIVTGIKLGWTMGWHGAISAELIKSTVGLGFLLYYGREQSDMAQVIGIIIITVIVGLLLDQFVFGALERRIRRRWGLLPSS